MRTLVWFASCDNRPVGGTRFGYTILYVRDVAASLAFYERAFDQRRRLLHESGQYAELETGSTTLAFASHELAAANLPQAFRPPAAAAERETPFEVCFVTNDVAATYGRALDAGASAVSEPQTKPWGQQVAYVRDPDGTLIELASPAR
jgi:lactoylglutathione lyase